MQPIRASFRHRDVEVDGYSNSNRDPPRLQRPSRHGHNLALAPWWHHDVDVRHPAAWPQRHSQSGRHSRFRGLRPIEVLSTPHSASICENLGNLPRLFRNRRPFNPPRQSAPISAVFDQPGLTGRSPRSPLASPVAPLASSYVEHKGVRSTTSALESRSRTGTAPPPPRRRHRDFLFVGVPAALPALTRWAFQKRALAFEQPAWQRCHVLISPFFRARV